MLIHPAVPHSPGSSSICVQDFTRYPGSCKAVLNQCIPRVSAFFMPKCPLPFPSSLFQANLLQFVFVWTQTQTCAIQVGL